MKLVGSFSSIIEKKVKNIFFSSILEIWSDLDEEKTDGGFSGVDV